MKPFYEMKDKKTSNETEVQPHTVMETPIWMNRFHTFWVILGVLMWIAFATSYVVLKNLGLETWVVLWYTTVPLFLTVLLDEKFFQKFYLPEWERSKQQDHVEIRGISFARIREWIEWNRVVRRKMALGLGFANVLVLVFIRLLLVFLTAMDG